MTNVANQMVVASGMTTSNPAIIFLQILLQPHVDRRFRSRAGLNQGRPIEERRLSNLATGQSVQSTAAKATAKLARASNKATAVPPQRR